MGMQKKTIESYVEKRIEYWSYSVKNPSSLKAVLDLQFKEGQDPTEEDKRKISSFQSELRGNVIVSGGCIASMLLGEEVNDIDIYFIDKEVAKKLSWYYLNEMKESGELKTTDYSPTIDVKDNNSDGVAIFIKSAGIAGSEIDSDNYGYFEGMADNAVDEFFDKYRKGYKAETAPKHSVKFISSNAITLNNGTQLILRFCGDPEAIHKNFDFVHATNYWTQDTGLVYRAEALQALLEKRLVYIGSRFPLSSMFRIRKFLKRGFKITAGEMVKIGYDISKLNLEDRGTLHDQLIGVDYAYFSEVIAIFRKESAKEIDRTYLFQVINSVFGDEEDTPHGTPE